MDWRDLAGTLIKAGAPIIGGALGGPLGGMIGGALGDVVANALGVSPTPEVVNNAISTMPADQLAPKLAAAEAEAQAKWPALAEIAKAYYAADTEMVKAGTADNANAREEMRELQQTGSALGYSAAIMSILVTFGFIAILGLYIYKPPAASSEVISLLVGTLAGAFTQVVSFWLGSSSSSRAKDATIGLAVAGPPPPKPILGDVITKLAKPAKR